MNSAVLSEIWMQFPPCRSGCDVDDVRYTFEIIVSFCSIHFNVVQPSKGYTAIARFAYQTCSVAIDRFGRVDYRRYAGYRVGGGVLLPTGAPAEFAEWENFLMAAAYTEIRRDGQEGRILDFALPRAVPRELLLPLASFALLPFLELGMAVRLDVECVPASDGERNPHAHGWLAQRVLVQDGFGLKERSWNTLFRRDGGRYVRALVAARLTLGCAILGIDAYVDPRPNYVRRAGAPEKRWPRGMWRNYNEGKHVEEIEQLTANRQLRRERKAPKHAPAPEVTSLTVTNAAVYHRRDDKKVAELRMRFADAAQEAGYELESELDAPSGLPTVSLTGTAVAFDGRAFAIAQTGNSEDAAIVARFVRQLDWRALVVEGGARLADLMAIAAASEGLFMLNRAPSVGARDLIVRAFYHELKAAIARHDPLGIAANFLAEFEANKAYTPVGVPAEETFLHMDAGSVDGLQSSAGPVCPNTASVQPGEAAVPASVFAPSVAIPGNDARGAAAGSNGRRTAGSPSEDLLSLPDDDSWKIKPNPAELARDAHYVQAYAERKRQELEDYDKILGRMRDRPSGLRDGPPAKRTTGSPSEALEEDLPDDDSWMIKPDPAVLARDARYVQAYAERKRQELEDYDKILGRMRDRQSGLRDGPSARRTTGSPSEALEKDLPDGDSRKRRPDPAALARNARHAQASAEGQRSRPERLDEIPTREQSSELGSDEPRPS